MTTVNMHQAKTHLSRLVQQALEGTPVVIAKSGTPLVRLTPVNSSRGPSRIGFMKGQIGSVPDDFDSMEASLVQEMFEGSAP